MRHINQLIQNPFVRSSTLVLVGSSLANFINYLFNLVLGRMLDPVAYGEMVAMTTLALILVIPSLTLSNLVTKFISDHRVRGERQMIGHTIREGSSKAVWIGMSLLVLFWLSIPWLASFLKIEKLPLFIFSFLLPLTMLLGSSKGALQGLQNFKPLTIALVLEALFKLVAAAALVRLGFSIAGAVVGLLVGTGLAWWYSFLSISKPMRQSGNEEISEFKFSQIPGYVKLVFLTNLFLALFGNIDVILAKHFLPELEAGNYAALAILGRIITFASIAIITVMLPMAASAPTKEQSSKYLKLAIGSTVLISSIILIFFFGMPDWTVRNLFGNEYVLIAPYLGLFGLVMLLGAIAKIFINYFLAVHQEQFLKIFGLITLIQFLLIWFMHTDISQFIVILLSTNILLLIAMSMVYIFSPKKAHV